MVVLECSSDTPPGCDTTRLKIGKTTAAGTFSVEFPVFTGKVGDGVCDATHKCFIGAVDTGQQTKGLKWVTFAGAPTPKPSPTKAPITHPTPAPSSSSHGTATGSGTGTTSGTTSGSGSISTDVPTAVAAGSGGGADRQGIPTSVILLTVLGCAGVVRGAATLARR